MSHDLSRRLRACAEDPMWADHAEVSKWLLAKAADELDRLRGLAADAARYRWLRDCAAGEIAFDHTNGQTAGGHRFVLHVPFDGRLIPNDATCARTMDESIDAALGGV